ncbi:1439_t:CDS:2 [Funneliformis geosporum]|uniref:16687_t:CDS:1 n=1 Tax=Funneliformis geosporum TaxID=1117311 RepID=A0A9W4WH79_9GLOM|nr:16687_t:CDS:2 [Funneliformis geosporum]CAI2165240.1 1439_t:CDS:2 [Funneliformis geosporum]
MSLKNNAMFDDFYKNPQKMSSLSFEELTKLADLAVIPNPNNKSPSFITSNKTVTEKTILNNVPLEKLMNFISSTQNFNVANDPSYLFFGKIGDASIKHNF